MQVYAKDSSASAVVLSDIGSTHIDVGTKGTFQLIYERHTRIKILTKDGYEHADVSIPVYHNNGNREKVNNIKGYTYTMEKGLLTKTKLARNAIFEEEVSEYSDRIKFTMPNVKEGSVLEYSYRIVSDFLFNFQPWTFQSSIPTVWSEYRAKFIEYYEYQLLTQGYVPMMVNEKTNGVQHYTIGAGASETAGFTAYHLAAADVPAFKQEPFMTTEDDYISKVEFQLRGINFPRTPYQPVMGTWPQLDKRMLEHSQFGGLIGKSAYFKKIAETLTFGETEPMAKAQKIHAHVVNTMTWNGATELFASSSANLKKAYEAKKGNSAEINLILTLLLKEAGLRADPVLLSTRNHGRVRTQYPLVNQFNNTICAVTVGEFTLALDATDPLIPFGMLPAQCINETGRAVRKNDSYWISLTPYGRDNRRSAADWVLAEDGSLTGKLSYSSKGYSAKESRQKYFSQGKEEYLENFANEHQWTVKNAKFKNERALGKPFKESYEIEIEEGGEAFGNMIYINPLRDGRWEENPFKTLERAFPVSFACPWKTTDIVKLTLPEGYTIDEQPETMLIALPGKAGKYTYSITTMGNVVAITSTLDIKKNLFTAQDYSTLREFFAKMVAKQSEQLVLKKAN